MKTLSLITLIAALCTGMASAQQLDQAFYLKASGGGMAEVQLGQLAVSKAKSADVKAFGRKMVEDHSKSNTKLAALAAKKGAALAKTLDAEHAALIMKLEALSGAAFDSAYVDAMVKGHSKMAALLEEEISSGKDADATAFARETLPVVKEHLSMVLKLEAGSSGMPH